MKVECGNHKRKSKSHNTVCNFPGSLHQSSCWGRKWGKIETKKKQNIVTVLLSPPVSCCDCGDELADIQMKYIAVGVAVAFTENQKVNLCLICFLSFQAALEGFSSS